MLRYSNAAISYVSLPPSLPLMTIPPTARCETCKQEFPSRKAARQHAVTSGHAGPVGYFCRECDENLGKLKRFNGHVNTTGHTRPAVSCTQCALQFKVPSELLMVKIIMGLVVNFAWTCPSSDLQPLIASSHGSFQTMDRRVSREEMCSVRRGSPNWRGPRSVPKRLSLLLHLSCTICERWGPRSG